MAERDDLLTSVAVTIADYRKGEVAVPDPAHVQRWVNQFENKQVQLPILRELDHVLKQTYFSRAGTRKFLARLFQNKALVGDDACAFWKRVKFLDIQRSGASQKEMLALFSKVLEKECGFGTESCGATPRAFVYLDDAIFTGNRVRSDLEKWVADEAPAQAKVHIVTIALHSLGRYYADGKIKEAAKAAAKNIDLTWWSAIELEDRKAYTTTSDVLRPVAIPDDEEVKAYVARMRYQPHLRTAGNVGGKGIFSSDKGRRLLEEQFLVTGVQIRNMCPNLADTQRPLGRMKLETLGFGSLIVTFRNCPNNTPLAFWVDSPWYPLFPRATNTHTSLKAMLAQEGF
jgi:hypothetical protein